MKISFLLHNAYGIGGTIRSTFNVAGALAAHHSVEIVTVMRTLAVPSLPLHPAVRLVPLIDTRPEARSGDHGHALLTRPTAYVPAPEAIGAAKFNALTDERVAAFLAGTDADVVIATRPGLVIYLAELGRGRYLRIGQEHRIYESHGPAVRSVYDAAIARLDAFTTVSEADAETHRRRLPEVTTLLRAAPNGVPGTAVEPSDGSAKLVVAAGRLVPVKRYDLLIDAWHTVAAQHPDWRLRIYGRGPLHTELRRRIDTLGLTGQIALMGAHAPIETEWAKGSIAAVTSREESFGMTIVEAMHCGVPVVSTDCPHGPREIITDGKDGLLVPVGDAHGIAAGLLKLIGDEGARRAMGQAARSTAERYAPERVASAYEALIGELPPPAGRRTPLGRLVRRLPLPGRGRFAAVPTPREAGIRTRVGQLIRKPLRPTGSCRVDRAGNVTVLIEPERVRATELELTLTRRRHGDIVRVPLIPPTGPSAPWTALLDRRVLDLAGGRWDLHVVRPADGARRRVLCRYAEGRGLIGLEPLPGTPFCWWLPYPTLDGYLALRAWRRPVHAEARTLLPTGEALTVKGSLHGASFEGAAAPVLAATPRSATGTPFTVPVEALDGSRFRCVVPYERIHAARAEGIDGKSAHWDLSLRLAPETDEPIRIGRVLSDIQDLHKTELFPVIDRVRPYLTKSGYLSIKRSD